MPTNAKRTPAPSKPQQYWSTSKRTTASCEENQDEYLKAKRSQNFEMAEYQKALENSMAYDPDG